MKGCETGDMMMDVIERQVQVIKDMNGMMECLEKRVNLLEKTSEFQDRESQRYITREEVEEGNNRIKAFVEHINKGG